MLHFLNGAQFKSQRSSVICVYFCVDVGKAVHMKLVSYLFGTCFLSLDRVLLLSSDTLLLKEENLPSSGMIMVLISWVLIVFSRSCMHSHSLKEQRKQSMTLFHSSDKLAEWAPHVGGLWEAAIKSFKIHLKRIVGESKFDFEEMVTILTQIEACLNSHPLGPVLHNVNGIEILIPRYFLIGCPLQAIQIIPDPLNSSVLYKGGICAKLL